MSVEAEIQKLLDNHPKGFDLSLDRISALLALLGNPHLEIPPAFHLAGTNGKGSTSAFLRSILEAAGLTSHVHTSPHLVNWNERYRLGKKPSGEFVSDKKLEAAIVKAANANAGRKITVFEIMSAVAFILFSENKADYSIIEVGLGGRFDATNVIKNPLVSVITPVDLDHQAYLGDTIEKIAFEKAGIIKKGIPVIVGPQKDEAREVLEQVASERGCKIWFAQQDFDGFEQRGRFVYQDQLGLLDLPLPNIKGAHQISNATNAIAATRIAGLNIEHDAYEEAMQQVTWPGRFERLPKGALLKAYTKKQIDNLDIWIDGGHNPQAGEMLAKELKQMSDKDDLPLYMICGMLTTKDPSGFFDHFKGLVDKIVTIPISQSEAAFSAIELASIARKSNLDASPEKNIESAFSKIIETANGNAARIMICGSLYMVGEVLEKNQTAPR